MSGTNGHASNGNGRPHKNGGGGSLDMSSHKDRGVLLRSISSGWGVKPEMLAAAMEGLVEVMALARADANVREYRGCINCMRAITDQIQRDEHRLTPELHDHSVHVTYDNAWTRKREAQA